MKQILLISPRYLHNDEHDQLYAEIQKLIEDETPAKLGIGEQYPEFQLAREAETTALQVELGSVYTKNVSETDGYRDQLDMGFQMFVESHEYHFDPEVQENARRVLRILNQYGNIRKLGYNAESSNLSNRNAEISTNYAADVAALGNGLGTLWLAKLNEANNQFIDHFGERADEEAARVSGNVLNARTKVDAAFQAISTRINALAVVNGDAAYTNFIDKANYYINYYKETVTARKGRKGNV